jgi:hypothetical protein
MRNLIKALKRFWLKQSIEQRRRDDEIREARFFALSILFFLGCLALIGLFTEAGR